MKEYEADRRRVRILVDELHRLNKKYGAAVRVGTIDFVQDELNDEIDKREKEGDR